MNTDSRVPLDEGDCKTLNALGVELVVLFGSQAQNTATAGSDFDLGVFLSRASFQEQKKGLYDALYDLFAAKINRLVDIDIVFLEQAPLELLGHVLKHGVALYERTPQSFARFREAVMNRYADFAPLLSVFQSAILARIAP